MDLPKKKLKKQKGQVLVIFLLIIVMVLAIVLSVASRTITDIRTTSTTDESNRAYFAAEAGIEAGLQKVKNNPAVLPFSAKIDNVTANTTVNDYSTSSFSVFIYPTDVERDSVAQINLSGWGGNLIYLAWGSTQDEAVEASVITYNGTSYGMRKFTFDSYSGRADSNGFCHSTHGPYGRPGLSFTWKDDVTGLSKDFYYQAYFSLHGADTVPGCTPAHDPPLSAGETPVMLRIRPLFNTSPTPIAVLGQGASLPSQGTIVASTANTPSGVTRKIQAVQLYSALPSLFDYVLFTNGDLSK